MRRAQILPDGAHTRAPAGFGGERAHKGEPMYGLWRPSATLFAASFY